ncbi:hypothetical protein BDV34DRAFT_226341 [Aspergillus parasiticus]|uniref:Uncharacterized protein n=1 Tax=Aspergillus parasiticus TaxID=5067 RepID=A0A5N6DHD2_ASPPA|nr:hypothetical protein BDV34DRAFT_226341 [Aspergillus parasiticus]
MAEVNGGQKLNPRVLANLVDPKKQFNVACAYQHAAPMIDTDVALVFLMKLVQSKWAHADIIVNRSGIGARGLATDIQIFPVRGAVKKITRPEGYSADHAFLLSAQMNHDGSVGKTVFIVPCNDDTLVIGSIIQRNNWQLTLSPDSPEVKAMWNGRLSLCRSSRVQTIRHSLLHKACAPSLI